MAQHTPGPWSYEAEMGMHVIRGAPTERPHKEGGTYTWSDYVASTWGGEHEANARLIAAAPALLEALKVARDCIWTDRTALADCHMHPVTNALDAEGAAGVAEYDAALAQIDAAIAAARGKA